MDANETKIYIALLIIAVLLVVVITVFTITVLHHRRRSLQLYKEKLVAEITTLENERKRIASDLHDELGPLMSAIKLQLATLDTAGEEDRNTLQKANRYIDDMVEKIRVTSNDLVPLVLERKGFNVALDQFAASVSTKQGMQVNVNRETEQELPPHKAIHLFRIIKEMINNSIRHGRARNCQVHISGSGGMLSVRITDDGTGFNFENISRLSPGFGLQNILSRAEMLGAEILIDAKQGKGVSYLLEIPMNDHEKK